MGSLSGLQEYQVYVYNCEKFNKSAEKAPLLEWQDLIDATVTCYEIKLYAVKRVTCLKGGGEVKL